MLIGRSLLKSRSVLNRSAGGALDNAARVLRSMMVRIGVFTLVVFACIGCVPLPRFLPAPSVWGAERRAYAGSRRRSSCR